jgi:hypothetical protein
MLEYVYARHNFVPEHDDENSGRVSSICFHFSLPYWLISLLPFLWKAQMVVTITAP